MNKVKKSAKSSTVTPNYPRVGQEFLAELRHSKASDEVTVTLDLTLQADEWGMIARAAKENGRSIEETVSAMVAYGKTPCEAGEPDKFPGE